LRHVDVLVGVGCLVVSFLFFSPLKGGEKREKNERFSLRLMRRV
jgi:hypothetical protein